MKPVRLSATAWPKLLLIFPMEILPVQVMQDRPCPFCLVTPLFSPISNFLSKLPNLALNSTRTCFHLCSISWVLVLVDIIIFRHSFSIYMKAGTWFSSSIISGWMYPGKWCILLMRGAKTSSVNQFKEIMRPGVKVKNVWPTSRGPSEGCQASLLIF